MSSLKINQFHFWSVENLISWKFRSFGHWKIRWVALQCRAKSQLTVFQCLSHKRRTKQLKPNYLVLWVTVGQTRLHFRPFVVVESFFSLSGFFAELACFVIRVDSMLSCYGRSLIGSRAAKLIWWRFYWQTNGSLFSCWETYLVRESRVTGNGQTFVQWSQKQLMDSRHFLVVLACH